jgi:hypothetical protein
MVGYQTVNLALALTVPSAISLLQRKKPAKLRFLPEAAGKGFWLVLLPAL